MSTFDFSANSITGEGVRLDLWRGHVCLIVNVASKCGYTPQYTGLEALYRRHKDRGFTVLGFPCDQFGSQEPADEAAIVEFCTLNFGVTFPMFAKIAVNGSGTHPLWAHLKKERPGLLGTESVKWNFTKFLVDRSGRVRERFRPSETPEQIEGKVVALLDEPVPAAA